MRNLAFWAALFVSFALLSSAITLMLYGRFVLAVLTLFVILIIGKAWSNL
jgi:hypothetical protein